MNLISRIVSGLVIVGVTAAILNHKSEDDKKLINRINKIKNSRKQKEEA